LSSIGSCRLSSRTSAEDWAMATLLREISSRPEDAKRRSAGQALAGALAAFQHVAACPQPRKEWPMLFMVIERFRNRDAKAVYRRFRDQGRHMPPGLSYVGSWIEANFDRCFQVMESDDASSAAVGRVLERSGRVRDRARGPVGGHAGGRRAPARGWPRGSIELSRSGRPEWRSSCKRNGCSIERLDGALQRGRRS
jgi:Domain of unknown function (DUF3303)